MSLQNKNKFKKKPELKEEPTYHELKVDAEGKQLPEAITVDIESLGKRIKSKVYQLRLTPFEHAKLFQYCDNHKDGIKVADLFSPIINRIAKKK